MFNEGVDPLDILQYLMESSEQTLKNLLESGFPLESVPPHHFSVYASEIELGGTSDIAVTKEDLAVLTHEDKEVWAPLMLFKLDSKASPQKLPLGAFLGFIGSSESDPLLPLFIGVLLSPTGREAVGMYAEISSLTGRFCELWEHPFELIPHLDQPYRTKSEDPKVH